MLIPVLLVLALEVPCRADDRVDPDWAVRQESYVRIPTHGDVVWTPVLWFDADWLHLESRYNYEDVGLGSVLAGVHLRGGATLTYDLHLMAGVAFGGTAAAITGYRLALALGSLDLASEGELFVDPASPDVDFLYTWTELGWSPTEWLRVGGAIQRTRVVQSSREVEAGPFAGVSWWVADLTLYVFGLGSTETLYTVLLGFSS